MTLDKFKDCIFDVLNEMDDTILADIDTNDETDTFSFRMADGSVFEIVFREAQCDEQKDNNCYRVISV